MNLDKIANSLKTEMERIEVDRNVVSALNTLMWAASETDILPFKLHGEFREIIQLVKLAEKFAEEVPRELIP